MLKIRVIKIYMSEKPNKVMDGYPKEGVSYEGACRDILKKHKVRNVGKFLCVFYLNDGVYINIYLNGIKEGTSRVVWFDYETLKDILEGKRLIDREQVGNENEGM